MDRYYKHSGKFSPLGVVLGLLAGTVVSVPLAFAYNYGIFSIPEARLRVLCTLAYGALVGAASGVAMCWGKVRSKAVAGLISFGASLFALYLSWAVWILHLVYPSFWVFNPLRAALHPRRMWKFILAVSSKGTWSFNSGPPTSGFSLWVVWGSEAVLLLGFGVLAAVALVKRRAFCERCEQWCSQSQKLYFAPVLSADQFKARLEAEDLASLQTLAPGDPKKPHFRVDLHSCADCHTLNTLSLVQNFARDRDETILMGLAPCVRCSRKRLLTTSFRMNAQNCRTVL